MHEAFCDKLKQKRIVKKKILIFDTETIAQVRSLGFVDETRITVLIFDARLVPNERFPIYIVSYMNYVVTVNFQHNNFSNLFEV